MIHILERSQELPIPLKEAWDFFSDPQNLARITPQNMGFVIHHPAAERPICAGQRISYTVRPLLGIPLRWVTLITEAEPPHRFVDTQERGPYALWRHTHRFSGTAAGTLMNDRVEYAMPFGLLGELAHRSFVKKQLEGIFNYREKVLLELFPTKA